MGKEKNHYVLWFGYIITKVDGPLKILKLEALIKTFTLNQRNTMKKRGVLQLASSLNFWVASNICNSLYLYAISVNGQVAWVAKLQFIVYATQLITTQLQLYQNNSFSTIMWFHYNCTHDVMMMSLIVIHPWKYDTWHMKFFGHKIIIFSNIDFYCPLWLLMMIWNCDTWHNKKIPHGILVVFWIFSKISILVVREVVHNHRLVGW
jgi:hypothetical protein